MQDYNGVDSAVGFDIGSLVVPVAQSMGRLVVVLMGWIALMGVVRRLIGRIDDDRFRAQLLFFVPKIVAILMAVVALAAVGIDVSGMAAIMATVGFTGAVIFTPVGQNLVAGAMIRIDDIYRVGEAVTVGDIHGNVAYRSMLRTELELPDGSKAWVPNSAFQENQVQNHSRMGGWRICVQVPLDCASDRTTAHRVMDEVVATLAWNSDGKRPFVAFDHVGSEAMFFNAYAWIDDRTQEPWFRGLLLSTIVDALEEAGVSVGQTTNLSIGANRRIADEEAPTASTAPLPRLRRDSGAPGDRNRDANV